MSGCLGEPLTLQLILAGPVLRRVDSSRVSVWLATSKPVYVILTVYNLDLKSKSPKVLDPVIGFGDMYSKPVGSRLHLTLVTAKPVSVDQRTPESGGSFPPETILGYDLELREVELEGRDNRKRPGAIIWTLSTSTLRDRLTYDIDTDSSLDTIQRDPHIKGSKTAPLPSFYIQDRRKPPRLLHGSCRALHGAGSDASILIDHVLQKTVNKPESRASALFLTGDQIYADDVASCLIGHLTRLGFAVLGWDQHIRGMDNPTRLIDLDARMDVIEEHVGFTSSHGDNHLLSLAEYVAMYLLAWNQENWPCRLPDFDPNWTTKRKIAYDKQKEELTLSQPFVWRLRRAMANIPTYMIFDDHEVTDDWNTDRGWNELVYHTKVAGRQILSNALIAYCLFQAWGNDPERFEPIVDQISQYLEQAANPYAADTSYDKKLEELILSTDISTDINWSFVAPSHPPTLVLDTRTKRKHGLHGRDPPELIEDKEFENLERLLLEARNGEQNLFKKKDPLLIVSPVPVFGPIAIERGQGLLSPITGNYAIDNESWKANFNGFMKFINFLISRLEIEKCIFLSGDVHVAYTIGATITECDRVGNRIDPKRTLHVTQLTSSALKNITPINDFLDRLLGKTIRETARMIVRKTIHNPYVIHIPLDLKAGSTNELFAYLHSFKGNLYLETIEYIHPDSSFEKFVFNSTNIARVRTSVKLDEVYQELLFLDPPVLDPFLRPSMARILAKTGKVKVHSAQTFTRMPLLSSNSIRIAINYARKYVEQ